MMDSFFAQGRGPEILGKEQELKCGHPADVGRFAPKQSQTSSWERPLRVAQPLENCTC